MGHETALNVRHALERFPHFTPAQGTSESGAQRSGLEISIRVRNEETSSRKEPKKR